jgi:hypothetical protein
MNVTYEMHEKEKRKTHVVNKCNVNDFLMKNEKIFVQYSSQRATLDPQKRVFDWEFCVLFCAYLNISQSTLTLSNDFIVFWLPPTKICTEILSQRHQLVLRALGSGSRLLGFGHGANAGLLWTAGPRDVHTHTDGQCQK